jgi:hypothetical protein
VNHLDAPTPSGEETDLVARLFWRYSGRSLPARSPKSEPRPPEPETTVEEEEELARSDHQGELDRFVLRWRAAARAIALSAGDNDSLREQRIEDTLSELGRDVAHHPDRWPSCRIDFVKDLLRRRWPE